VRTRHLHVLPRVQWGPLNPLILRESYLAIPVRALIFWCISHLDAFSGSCSRTWLRSLQDAPQLLHQRSVQPGPLVLGPAPVNALIARSG